MKKKIGLISAFVALFAAIISVSCFIKIPIGPIPIVLQNMMVVLCGVLMGSYLGGAPGAVWLLAGLAGLPVYSGGASGIGVWIGPTGGFLPGYLIGAVVAGFIAGKPSVQEKKITLKVTVRIVIAMLAGMIILYVPGLLHFAKWAVSAGKVPADKTVFAYCMSACCLPFIPGDILKLVVAVPVALKIRPVLAQYLFNDVKEMEVSENKDEL